MKDKNFWIWGLHSVEAAIENFPDLVLEVAILKDQPGLEALVGQCQDQKLNVRELDAFPKEYSSKRHQGILAAIKRSPASGLPEFNFSVEGCKKNRIYQWALLDRVEDPRNFGAILRSAAAFGLSGVIYGGREQAPVTGVVAQASAGQCFRVPLIELTNTNQIFRTFEEASARDNAQVAVAALDMDGQLLNDFAADQRTEISSPRHVVWILGSEGRGVRPGLLERSSHKVSIPMEKSVESLNVSVASSLAFYSLY